MLLGCIRFGIWMVVMLVFIVVWMLVGEFFRVR